MTERDRIDELVAQWKRERPDIDSDVMAVVGRLLAVGVLAGRRLDAFAAAHGLDRGQGDVLLTLRRSGKPYRLSPSELTSSLLVTSGTMTNRLARLEKLGLVERRANPDDGRGLDVQLTAKGVRLVDRLVVEHVENEKEILAPLSARDRQELARITRKLLAHLAAEPQ